MNIYIKNYILSVINTIISLLFPLITFPYVSRVLGPENLGIINFTQSYGYYFIHIASFGISSYAIREVSKVRNCHEKVEKISNEVFNLNFFFSILSTFLYFLGVIFVNGFRDNFSVFLIYSFVILLNFLSLDWLLQSYDDYFFSTVRNLIIRTLCLIAVFTLVRNKYDYLIYMMISCVSEMGTRISTLLYCRKKYSKLRIRRRFLNFKDHIKAMFTLFSFRLVNGMSANLDKLMIGFMMIYANVGIYSAGVKIVLMLSAIVETVGIVLFPKINISADVSMEEYRKNIKVNYDLILLLGIPMSVGLFLISARIIPLFAGNEYSGAIPVSRIMAVIILIGPIGDMLGSKILLIFKKDRWLLLCSGVVAASNVVLNVALIPFWGISGAAIASILSYVIAVLLRYYFSRKIVKINLLNTSFIKYGLFTAPFAILYVLFKSQIDNNNIWMTCFVLICSLIYLAELIFSKDYLMQMVIRKVFRKQDSYDKENCTK